MASRLPGQYVGADLGPGYYGPGNTVPADLGTDSGYVPPDPPEPAYRGARASVGMAWSEGRGRVRRSVVTGWAAPVDVRASVSAAWRDGSDARADTGMAWGDANVVVSRPLDLAWGESEPVVRKSVELPWLFPNILRRSVGLPWAQTQRIARAVTLAYEHSQLRRRSVDLPWQHTETRTREISLPWPLGVLRRRAVRLPWRDGDGLPWIVLPPDEPPPPPIPEGRISGRYVGADLGCPAWAGPFSHIPANLGVIACFNVRPRRRTYIVINDVTVVRLPERTPIEHIGGKISMDLASWAKTLELSPATAADLALIKPGTGGPREVEVTLNGEVQTFIIEDWKVDRRFAQHRFSASGRSRTALLAAPYAPARTQVNDELSLASQLAAAEVMDTGFDVTYDTVDWNVTEGAWAYSDTTPMDALLRIAAASGAVVQSHPEDKTVVIRPRYPASPWAWTVTSPDGSLVEDLSVQTSISEESKPMYDKVVVAGEQQGVVVIVTRDGAPGEIEAPQVVDPLITDQIAGTERGRNILSDRGRQLDNSFQLPVFPLPIMEGQVGLLYPLDFYEVAESGTTWLGLVTSNTVTWQRDGAKLTVWQTPNIERHPQDAN